MSRAIRDALELRVKAAEAEAHICLIGMQTSLNGEIVWIDSVEDDDGGQYKFGVARLSCPHGGLFFTRFDYPEQNPSFTVAYLDEVLSSCRNNPLSEFSRIRVQALDKAVTMRHKAIA